MMKAAVAQLREKGAPIGNTKKERKIASSNWLKPPSTKKSAVINCVNNRENKETCPPVVGLIISDKPEPRTVSINSPATFIAQNGTAAISPIARPADSSLMPVIRNAEALKAPKPYGAASQAWGNTGVAINKASAFLASAPPREPALITGSKTVTPKGRIMPNASVSNHGNQAVICIMLFESTHSTPHPARALRSSDALTVWQRPRNRAQTADRSRALLQSVRSASLRAPF